LDVGVPAEKLVGGDVVRRVGVPLGKLVTVSGRINIGLGLVALDPKRFHIPRRPVPNGIDLAREGQTDSLVEVAGVVAGEHPSVTC
jgi:hypothetical protein